MVEGKRRKMKAKKKGPAAREGRRGEGGEVGGVESVLVYNPAQFATNSI